MAQGIHPSHFRDTRQTAIERRSAGMGVAIEAQMLRLARWQSRRAGAHLKERGLVPPSERMMVVKAPPPVPPGIVSGLKSVFEKFGLRQMAVGGQDAAERIGGKFVVRDELKERHAKLVENKVVLLLEETEQGIRESLDRIIADALRERPRPSAREVGRRIARQWHGNVSPDTLAQVRGEPEEDKLTADWRRRNFGGPADDEREHLFSYQRARTIAQTELLQAEQAAISDAYVQTGIEKIKWVARRDGRSGSRRHGSLHNDTITVEAMNGTNQSEWFVTPLGNRTPYPGWSGLPAADLVNCRCTHVPA